MRATFAELVLGKKGETVRFFELRNMRKQKTIATGRDLLVLVLAACVITVSCCKVDYKDPTAPIEKRVESLLSQMTLEEKVGQMNQFCGVKHVEESI